MDIYNSLLTNMEEKYTQLTGCATDDASDIGIRLKVLAGELAGLYNQLGELESQVFPHTSSGKYLARHCDAQGITRRPAVASAGMLRFSRQSPATADITISLGTLVSASTLPDTTFSTTDNCVLKTGETWVEVTGRAENKGNTGNLSTGKINVLISTPAGITTVTNPTPFTGGQDTESDDSLKSRLVASYSDASNTANPAYYRSTALSLPGIDFANVLPRSRGIGTVDVAICGGDEGQEDKLVAALKAIYSNVREISVDVKVASAVRKLADVSVQLQLTEGEGFQRVSADCKTAVTNYINQLDIGSSLRLTHLGKIILGVKGVLDYRFTLPIEDIKVLGNQVVRPKNITIHSWGG